MSTEIEKYRCAPMVRMRQGIGQELLHFPFSGVNLRTSSPIAAALEAWTGFRTIEQATAEIAASLPSLSRSEMTVIIDRLIAQNGLISLTGLVKPSATQKSVDTAASNITWLAIPTADRSGSLKRALDTYIANIRSARRQCGLFVSDDSRNTRHNSECLRILNSLEAPPLTGVYYAGIAEKMAFVERITEKTDIPQGVVEYALCGSGYSSRTPGANRNTILCHTLGSSILTVDDDTVCTPRQVSETHGGLTLAGHGDPTEMWCFPCVDEAVAFGDLLNIDVIGEHEDFLGKSINNVIVDRYQRGRQLNLDGMCGHLFASLFSETGEIRATSNGTRGDNGFKSDLGLISHRSQATRKRIQELGTSYLQTLESRQTARQAPCVTIAHAGPWIGMCTGLDNRTLLPPFMPECNNEDGVFSYILGRISDNSYLAHLPFTLAHVPSDPRHSYLPNKDAKFTLADLIIGCLSTWRPDPGCDAPAERIEKMGSYLRQLADLPSHDFDDLSNILMCANLSATIEMLEGLLISDNFMPRHWAEDIDKRIEALRHCTDDPDFFAPADLPGECDESPRRRAPAAVGRYGALLECWPAISEQICKLREDGITLGREVTAVKAGLTM